MWEYKEREEICAFVKSFTKEQREALTWTVANFLVPHDTLCIATWKGLRHRQDISPWQGLRFVYGIRLFDLLTKTQQEAVDRSCRSVLSAMPEEEWYIYSHSTDYLRAREDLAKQILDEQNGP